MGPPLSAKRLARMQEGLLDLRRWLRDLARDGWGAHADDPEHFEAMARRLVDAQAPGLASRIRRLGESDGPPDAARRVGGLHLLATAFDRLETLDPERAADVLTLVGVNMPKKRVLEGAVPIEDRWWVLGSPIEEDEELGVRRTWILGEATGRIGLILDFAPPSAPFPPGPAAGTAREGPAFFYPSAEPLRCLLDPEARVIEAGEIRPELARWLKPLSAAWRADRERRVHHPWLGRSVLGIAEAHLGRDDAEGWWLTDSEGSLPLVDEPERAWPLLAASGGQVAVWGELEGTSLRPLAAWADGQLLPLGES